MPEVLEAGFLPREGSGPGLPALAAGPAAGFGSGDELDTMGPCVTLAGFADDVTGPDGRCTDACDDELIGVLRAWDRLESWTAARKLSVIAELIRRRPAPGCPPGGPGALPTGWGKFCGDELAAATATSGQAADKTLALAHDLASRLPGTARALHEGIITLYKARIIADATHILDPAGAATAEALALRDVAGKTPGQLRAAIARAVTAVNPAAARARRERAQRDARVELWREDAGTAALCGRELPPADALAADQRITTYARDLRAAGLDGTLDQLRARAFLDLALGVCSRPPSSRDPGDPGAGQENGTAGSGQHSSSNPAGSQNDTQSQSQRQNDTQRQTQRQNDTQRQTQNDTQSQTQNDTQSQTQNDTQRQTQNDTQSQTQNDTQSQSQSGAGKGGTGAGNAGATGEGSRGKGDGGKGSGDKGGTRNGSAGRASAAGPGPGTGIAARINLTIPLMTLLGLAERPGEASGLGAIDPALARTLADSAAGNPQTTWCVTVTGEHGHPTAHGCARPARGSRASGSNPPTASGRPSRSKPGSRSKPSRPGGPGDRDGPPSPNKASGRGATGFTRETNSEPPGGYGLWRLRLGGGRELLAVIEPLAVLDCDHRHESAGYQPSGTLRHLVEIRDGECTWPPCRRAARRCDFEHAIPWDQGGRTCACNAGARCRHHHHAKQAHGWRLEQNQPGHHTWTTPAGRTYTTGPIQYPV